MRVGQNAPLGKKLSTPCKPSGENAAKPAPGLEKMPVFTVCACRGQQSTAMWGGDPLSFSDPMGLLRGVRNTSRTCVLCGRNIYQQQAAAIWRQYEAKMQLEAQQNAFLRNYREALGRHEHYGDGLGALSGAGAEIRHPSVPNSLEDLINPRRKLPWVPQIPPTGAPNCSRYPSASASPSP